MARILWDHIGERVYETGVDRGVLYVDEAPGVPWSGLVSIDESPTGGTSQAHYLDGVKFRNQSTLEEFEATLQAYTYPREFDECNGTFSLGNGLFATQQRRKSFSLAYRTLVGNDVRGQDYAYKIHLVYDAKAEPSSFSHKTVNDSAEVGNFSWKLTTKPSILAGIRPTSHFVIDSRDTPPALLGFIEDILYGTELTFPRLPSAGELEFLFKVFENPEYDGGTPLSEFYYTYDGGPVTNTQTETIDGGAP